MNNDTHKVTRSGCGASARLSAVIVTLLTAAGLSWAGLPELAPVGDAGNASDVATGFGAVGYAYRIGVNEVTRAEYAAFLNAVAATDAHGLYNPNMGITRSGSPGSYLYAATDGPRSVAWVSWYDALRYANWLHNGQPSGAAGAAATEAGAYTFSGDASVSARSPEAKAFLPNEDEWYKAAYYQGGADAWYWKYPTRSDGSPLASLPSPSDNAANFDRAVNDVTPAGAYAATQGYYGTRDQAGNLWEWNETAIDGGDRGLRGGSYDDYPLLLQSGYRDSQAPADENEFVGFRVAAAPAAPPPPANRAPVAAAESFALDEASTLTVAAPGVLSNDTDADGDALTVVLVAEPAHGTLTLYANGAFTYTPAENYSGADSFSYSPNDGTVDGSAVSVALTVRQLLYALSVASGSGDGSYAAGTAVSIQADPAPAGMVFDRWAGDTAGIASVTSASTTLTVPRGAASVTATYKALLYALAVAGGSGDGSYAAGTAVNIQADPAPAGMVFDRWTGDTAGIASVTSASTTLTMQGSAASVTATYKALLYALTVASGSGDGSYAAGTVVNIKADAAPTGMVFDRWTGATAGIASLTSASTTLTMQGSAATVTATYKAATALVFDMTSAVWEKDKQELRVRGKGPAGKTVVVTDPSTGVKLGSCVVRSDRTWDFRVKRSSWQVPSRVRATCAGVTDEMPVTRKY